MIAAIFLLFVFFHGLVLANSFFKARSMIKIAAGFLFGTLISVSLVYWVACLLKSLDLSLILFFFFSIQLVLIFKKHYLQTFDIFKKLNKLDIGAFLALFLFSYYLFAKTFGYDSAHGNFLIASNVYLDFGAHIPFIRSFSMGNNFPGEVPFFQGSGLLYYFLFDFYTGVLEHLGMRIDIAYNFLSAISLTLLLLLIYELAQSVFKNKAISILSVVFFLFSSNLSFLTFFQKYGLSLHTFSNWWHNSFYLEGSPTIFSKTLEIAGFWNLNPYMNQRHLIFGVAFFFLYLLVWQQQLSNKRNNKYLPLFLGTSLGFLAMWHTMVFLAIFMISAALFLLYAPIRRQLITTLVIGGIIALPQLFLIKLHSANTILLKPGFLLEHMLTLQNIAVFWFINIGLALFTGLIGFLLSTKEQKKFFFVFLPLFLIPNLIHLSSRFTFDDHKYFNIWIIGFGMFSAFFIVKLFSKNLSLKLISVFLIIFLTLSGLISIMVIKNDIYTPLPDFTKNKFLENAQKLIPSNARTLTNGEIYDPITLIGKKTFIGRGEYVFVYGGETGKRLEIQQFILQPRSEQDMMDIVKKNHLQYLVLYKNNFAKNEKGFDRKYYDGTFIKLYEDSNGIIYKI